MLANFLSVFYTDFFMKLNLNFFMPNLVDLFDLVASTLEATFYRNVSQLRFFNEFTSKIWFGSLILELLLSCYPSTQRLGLLFHHLCNYHIRSFVTMVLLSLYFIASTMRQPFCLCFNCRATPFTRSIRLQEIKDAERNC